MLTIYIDGSSKDDVAKYAYRVYNGENLIERQEGFAGYGSNNLAEYVALIKAFRFLQQRRLGSKVVIRSDSQLLINQMSGRWKVRGGVYIKAYEEAIRLLKELKEIGLDIVFEWVPRKVNLAGRDL